jgi:hypothetical protein
MAYLKCFGVGLLMALAGAFAWLIYIHVEISRITPPEVSQRGGIVLVDTRRLFDSRALLVVLGFFVVGFFIEFMILKRGLLQPR